jgi:DNA-directed RNA polymerase specialized sigma24 family protein
MERTRLARASVAELKKNIKIANYRKEKIKKYLHQLHDSYSKGKISYAQYIETLHKKTDGRNIHELINHYESYIEHCKKEILNQKKRLHQNLSFNIFIFILLFSVLFASYFYVQPAITGFFTKVSLQEENFIKTINQEFKETTTYDLELDYEGVLTSLSLDGEIKGEGSIKIYLDDLLILDSSKIKDSSTSLITGASISLDSEAEVGGRGADGGNNKSFSEEINESNSEALQNTTNESSPFQEEPPASETVNETDVTNETPSESEEIKKFSSICEETCDLSTYELNKKTYKLRIEIENATLFLENINYGLLTEKAEENFIPEEKISTSQFQAVLNQPVKWTKSFSFDTPNSKIKIPKVAENIDITNSAKVKAKFSVADTEAEKEILIEDELGDYEITYETPSPVLTEVETEKGKRVTISSPENVHYENVIVFTNLSESLNVKNPSRVKIYWVEQNTYLPVEKLEDKDSNGVYDYIEWIAPSLSNQTFEIIVITKAEHLDKDKNFISDIYDEVKELDGSWSEPISNNEYVRVTFEKNLTNERDITIFPRVISGSPRIEVYEVDENILIAEFSGLNSNEYNKIFLTNLVGEQDTFDLRVIGGSVEIDHIVDPQSAYDYNSGQGTIHFVYENSAETTFPPVWGTDGIGGTEISSYTNVQSDNTAYITKAGGSNTEPSFRFNFTIAETPADINWIFVHINGFATFGGGEDADCYVANFNTPAWEKICDMPTSDGNCDFNITTSITNYISGTDQLVYLCEGKNLDGPDSINIDYIQVTVNSIEPDTTPPQSQNPSVDDTTPDPGQTVSHNINWTDDTALSSSKLEVNSSGANCDTTANVSSTTFSGITNWSNLTWSPAQSCEGRLISWKQYANDSSNNWNITSTQTYTVNNVAPTLSFGTNPVDTYNSSSSSVTFDLKVSDNLGVSYLILYGNWTGTWHANQTNSTPPVNDTFWSVTVNGISDGRYAWAAWGNDTRGNSAFTSSNRTLTVDTTPPTITLPVYTNGTQKENTETLTLNISVSDATTSPSACRVEVNGTNTTLTFSNGWCNTTAIPLTGLADGNHTINVYANDSLNNLRLNNSFVVDIVTLNSAPTIGEVEAISAQNPTESTTKSITFNFTATDTDGAADIDISSAEAYFNKTGETTRSNTSCVNVSAGVGNNINFTCTVNMWYYDANGAWTINVSVKDSSNEYAENSSTTFTYNLLTAMTMSPTALTWPTIFAGQTNIGSNADPITINNTGNDVDLNVNLTSYNLRGEITTSDFIYATNFTVQNEPEGCSGTQMSNATSINVTSAILQRGNNSLNYNNATSGQEQLYFCITGLPSGISPQPYSSSAYGSWEIKVLLALLIPRKKKKKDLKEDKLVQALGLIMDELREKYSLEKEDLVEEVRDKYGLKKEEIIDMMKLREKSYIPITVFTKKLGGLEAIVKYLKENLNLNYREISKMLSRDERTIWTAYKKSKKKMPEILSVEKTSVVLPIDIFKNRKFTVLEATILYLKERGMKFSEIAKLIKRDPRNVQKTYSRVIEKMKRNL